MRIAHLDNIIAIDPEKQLATVEPNVPLDSLVSRTLQAGLMPPVVMEFPGITVGGGFSGASGESTGWKEGLFDCSVEEVEIILGNGRVVHAKRSGDNAELFNAARCTLGTFGVITLLTIRLTKAKDSVQLVYHHTPHVRDTIRDLARICHDPGADVDFVEAIQYSMEKGVIITGRHMSSASKTTPKIARQRFDRAADPWFYMHAKSTVDGHTELIPTQSYLFRHDRGAFWSGEVLLRYLGLPNNRFVRWLLNPLTTARAIYKGMLATDSADGAIIQDLLLPVETSEAFVEYVSTELNIWPLWICPIKKKADAGHVIGWPFYRTECDKQVTSELDMDSASPSNEALMLNFGVWGPTDPDPTAFRKTNRDMEQKLRELRGMKVSYAANFYTEREFWDLYEGQRYQDLRRKWHAEALPNMYDKVRRKKTYQRECETNESAVDQDGLTWKDRVLNIWPFGGLYQIFAVLFK